MNLAARVQQTNIVLKILPKWFSFDCFVHRFFSDKSPRHNLNQGRKGFARPCEIIYSLISQSFKTLSWFIGLTFIYRLRYIWVDPSRATYDTRKYFKRETGNDMCKQETKRVPKWRTMGRQQVLVKLSLKFLTKAYFDGWNNWALHR